MDLLFLINGLLCFCFFIFFIFNYFKHRNINSRREVLSYLFMIVFLYFSFSLLFLLWFFNFLDYSETDFVLIFLIGLIFQTLLFLRIGYSFYGSKSFNLLSFVYLAVMILLAFKFQLFLKYGFLLSFIVQGFFFFQIILLGKDYRRLAFGGIFYSVISIIFYFLFLFGLINILVYFIIVSIIIFYSIWIFFLDIEKYSFIPRKFSREKHSVLVFINNIIFIVVLINFVFISTIAIHEFGHYGLSTLYECESSSIVYDGSFFHTDILCLNSDDVLFVVLGGILFPYLVGLLIILLGSRFMRDVGLLIIGFNSISLSRDLQFLGVSENFIFLSILFGILFIILGIYFFIRSKIDLILFY